MSLQRPRLSGSRPAQPPAGHGAVAALPNVLAVGWMALPWGFAAAGVTFPQLAALPWMVVGVGLLLAAPAVAGWRGGWAPLVWAVVPPELTFCVGLVVLRVKASSAECQSDDLACEWLGIPGALLAWSLVVYPVMAAVVWGLARGVRGRVG